jgi:hypothetical protein
MITNGSLLKRAYHLSCMVTEKCKFVRRWELRTIFQPENLKVEDSLERINSRWEKILKWILVKYIAKYWPRLTWRRIGSLSSFTNNVLNNAVQKRRGFITTSLLQTVCIIAVVLSSTFNSLKNGTKPGLSVWVKTMISINLQRKSKQFIKSL